MTTYYVSFDRNDGNNGQSWVNRKLTLSGAEDIPAPCGRGVYYPRDGCIDPHRFVVGLAEKAHGPGVQVWTKTDNR